MARTRHRRRAIVVETLTGHDDRLAQAEALARDYAAEQEAYHHGLRDNDPLPGDRGDAGGAMGGLTATRTGRQRTRRQAAGRHAMRILRPQPACPSARRRPAGPAACAAACGSPTAACSAARCRPRATARSSSDCCTPRPPSSSSSRPARAPPTGSSRSTAGARREHYLPGGASGTARLARRAARARRADRHRRVRAPAVDGRPREEAFVGVAPRTARAAARTRSRTRGFCGSTSTSPASCRRCGRSWPSGRATC